MAHISRRDLRLKQEKKRDPYLYVPGFLREYRDMKANMKSEDLPKDSAQLLVKLSGMIETSYKNYEKNKQVCLIQRFFEEEKSKPESQQQQTSCLISCPCYRCNPGTL